jgi:hypothetical protein
VLRLANTLVIATETVARHWRGNLQNVVLPVPCLLDDETCGQLKAANEALVIVPLIPLAQEARPVILEQIRNSRIGQIVAGLDWRVSATIGIPVSLPLCFHSPSSNARGIVISAFLVLLRKAADLIRRNPLHLIEKSRKCREPQPDRS